MKEKIFSLLFRGEENKKSRHVYKRSSSDGGGFAFIPLLWIVVFFILPFAIVLKISFSSAVFKIPPFSGVFSMMSDYSLRVYLNLKNYITILSSNYYLSAFLNSILLAFSSMIICLILGFPMAYGISNVQKPKTKILLLLLVSLSFWTSFLIRIYAWMNLLSFHGVVNSFLMYLGIIKNPIRFLGNYYAVCLGMVFCYLPFMIFPIYAVLDKIDSSLLEAASDLGCYPTKSFWKITIPLAKEGIISGCTLVFSTAIGEFVIPELLGGSGNITIGRVLWTEFFSDLNWPMACALSIVIMGFVILPIFFLQSKTKQQ